MYIEQLKNLKKFNFALYLILFLSFTGIIVFNFLLSNGIDSTQMLSEYVKLFGKNITFVIIILPLALFCFGLLFWVKFVHQQSITSLTTARKKIDWSRIFFLFFNLDNFYHFYYFIWLFY